jgi:hypothetical protein
MLWGGLLMLVALLMLLGFLGKPVKSAAAVIGGAGWGTFIDELGKFLTHDNDYFFEPTFALIYVTFVLMYVAWEALHRRTLSREDALANALEITLEAVRKDMDAEERQRALDLLARCDPEDPVVHSLARAIAAGRAGPPGRPGPMWRARHAARALYRSLVRRRWFATAVVTFFIIHSLNSIVQSMIVLRAVHRVAGVVLSAGLILAGVLLRPGQPDRATRVSMPVAVAVVVAALVASAALAHQLLPRVSFFEWAELASSVLPALFVLVGITRMRRSRVEAYRTFKTAVLMMIFITQFFAFYHQQLLAMAGLTINILVWLTLRNMIQQEERLRIAAREAGP